MAASVSREWLFLLAHAATHWVARSLASSRIPCGHNADVIVGMPLRSAGTRVRRRRCGERRRGSHSASFAAAPGKRRPRKKTASQIAAPVMNDQHYRSADPSAAWPQCAGPKTSLAVAARMTSGLPTQPIPRSVTHALQQPPRFLSCSSSPPIAAAAIGALGESRARVAQRLVAGSRWRKTRGHKPSQYNRGEVARGRPPRFTSLRSAGVRRIAAAVPAEYMTPLVACAERAEHVRRRTCDSTLDARTGRTSFVEFHRSSFWPEV